jgi:phage tail sheath protein FI
MVDLRFKSAGVAARIINLTGPTAIQPVGIPAGVIGTSVKGPAFVPQTVATTQDFTAIFGSPADGAINGPLAISEWLRNRQAATFFRVLGVGQAKKRETGGFNQGRVNSAGFVVGDQQPQAGGSIGANVYANTGGVTGALYFLNAIMGEANSSGFLTDAGLSGSAVPMVRGVIMTASGVLITLSSSVVASTPPAVSAVAGTATVGSALGTVNIAAGRQEFVLLLNGHKGTSATYPNVITASFDPDAPNYLGNALNTDPLKLELAGHMLYADYSVHTSLAVVTASGLSVTGSYPTILAGREPTVFLSSGSLGRNTGSITAPSYENFEDRFRTPKSTWIISQRFGGGPKNLFRIHTLDDGIYANSRLKWSIENITPSISDVNPYGSFDILVRSFDDTDKKRAVIEAWRGLSLNPSSDKYIARVIGDTHTFFNLDAAEDSQKIVSTGDYPNRSIAIRVEVADEVGSGDLDPTALPMGFRGIPHLVTSGTAPLAALGATVASGAFSTTGSSDMAFRVVQMPIPFRKNLNIGDVSSQRPDKGLNWGVQFERKISATESNSTTQAERSIRFFSIYYPDFQTSWMNMIVSDNEGELDTVANGVLDADRFNNNLFTLENVKITQNTSTGLADLTTLVSWSYVRAGGVANTGSFRALSTTDLTDASVRQIAKFSSIVQGGFDGVRIFNNDTNTLSNTAIVEEMNNSNRGISDGPTVKTYQKALDIIVDDTETDIQLLTIPGIRHTIITDDALLKTENRFDAMYLMDIQEYDTANTLVSSSGQDISVRFTADQHSGRGLNSSFGAAYFPDVIINDAANNTVRQVPPSVAVLGAYGLNDAVGFPWFAPAGFARGALRSTDRTVIPLNRDNMDALQDVNINPLVSFAGSSGPVVWGQKTLLASDSALERVNVRRLLISLRRQVREIARRFVFEPGRAETLARFSQLVNPIMKKVQDQKGLEKFLVRIDLTTTTPTDIENKTIRGQIFLVPTRTLEFLSLDFVVTNGSINIT